MSTFKKIRDGVAGVALAAGVVTGAVNCGVNEEVGPEKYAAGPAGEGGAGGGITTGAGGEGGRPSTGVGGEGGSATTSTGTGTHMPPGPRGQDEAYLFDVHCPPGKFYNAGKNNLNDLYSTDGQNADYTGVNIGGADKMLFQCKFAPYDDPKVTSVYNDSGGKLADCTETQAAAFQGSAGTIRVEAVNSQSAEITGPGGFGKFVGCVPAPQSLVNVSNQAKNDNNQMKQASGM